MRVTHTNYMHPRHLRLEGCVGHPFFDARCAVDVLCVSPSSSLYSKFNRKGLPDWSAA